MSSAAPAPMRFTCSAAALRHDGRLHVQVVVEIRQVADHAARDHLPHDGRHVAHRAQGHALLGALSVWQVGAARRHGHGHLRGVEHLQSADAALAAFLTHDLADGVGLGLLDGREAQALRVELVCPAHAGYEPQPRVLAPLGDDELLRDGVDGVDHVVGAGERLERGDEVLLGEELVHRGDPAVGVDVVDDAFHHVGLGLADGGVVGHGLPVDVGGLHDVAVHQHELAHAAAREGLHAVGAHAAQAQHQHAGARQSVEPLLPQDDAQPVGRGLRLHLRSVLLRGGVLLVHRYLQGSSAAWARVW